MSILVETTYIKDVFETMMGFIRTEWDTVNDPVEVPYFMYGYRNEICQLLTEKDESSTYKTKKYPLIILWHGQEEDHGKQLNANYIISPLVSIITDSAREKRTSERYELSIKPTLYPLYLLLLEEIANNPAFYQTHVEEIENKIRVWDGSPSDDRKIGLMFNDYLDGVDIKFNNLVLFKEIETPSSFGS